MILILFIIKINSTNHFFRNNIQLKYASDFRPIKYFGLCLFWQTYAEKYTYMSELTLKNTLA